MHDIEATGPHLGRPGSRGGTLMPSADDVLAAAIGLVLAGAGFPEVAILANRACGRDRVPGHLGPGAAHPCASVTRYDDGKPAGAPDEPAGKLLDCERALRRAGFRVEYKAEGTAGYLLTWRKGRIW
jgi:hypothetical protein